jgi:ribosomal protein S18 acetylase RimI-like enzyme
LLPYGKTVIGYRNSEYLTREAIRSQNELVAITWILQERTNGEIAAYMIRLATGIAEDSNEKHFACRFITVDADIEHNENVIRFYQKNGFMLNSEMNNKRRTTISMRKDIYKQI